MPPKVSVLLPCFNAEQFLEKSISSVLSSTYQNFELIAVDDGSTDSTNEIIRLFKARDARLVLHEQPNSGIVIALNNALNLAQGKYAARMDADDICIPDRFEKQIAFLEANPSVLVVGGHGYLIDEDDDLISPISVVLDHDSIDSDLINKFNSRAMIHPAAMFRTKQIQELGGYREEFICAEDLDLFLRVAEHGKLANLDSVVIHYRKHGNSVTDTRALLQRRNAMRAANEARLRRGIPTVSYSEPALVANTENSLNRYYSTAVAALSNGWRRTAIKYLKKMVKEYGITKHSVKLALRLLHSLR